MRLNLLLGHDMRLFCGGEHLVWRRESSRLISCVQNDTGAKRIRSFMYETPSNALAGSIVKLFMFWHFLKRSIVVGSAI